jgi:hypothetical protein
MPAFALSFVLEMRCGTHRVRSRDGDVPVTADVGIIPEGAARCAAAAGDDALVGCAVATTAELDDDVDA